MLIIVRASVLVNDVFMFALFGYLLKFYLRKHEELALQRISRRSLDDSKHTTVVLEENHQSRRKLIIAWIIVLTVLKGVHTLTILLLNTLYQVTPDPRPLTLTLTFTIVQKLYVPIVDALITFSMLLFFYRQGMIARENDVNVMVKRNRQTARILEKNPNYFRDRGESVDSEVRVIGILTSSQNQVNNTGISNNIK